jgi:hypothetical protein
MLKTEEKLMPKVCEIFISFLPPSDHLIMSTVVSITTVNLSLLLSSGTSNWTYGQFSSNLWKFVNQSVQKYRSTCVTKTEQMC